MRNEEAYQFGLMVCACEFSSANKFVVQQHQRTHSNAKDFQCVACDYRSKTIAGLWNHRRRSCRGLSRVRNVDCRLCKKTFLTKMHLSDHVRNTHMGQKRHKCDHCEYRTNDSSTLLSHVSKEHAKSRQLLPCGKKTVDADERKKRQILCDFPECNFATTNSEYLRCHTRRHCPELKNVPCPMYPKTFYCSRSLTAHIGHVHVGEKPLKCEFCDYATSHLSSLRYHYIRVHTESKTTMSQLHTDLLPSSYHTEAADPLPQVAMTITEVYACPFCSWNNHEKMAVVRHSLSHREAVVVLERTVVV